MDSLLTHIVFGGMVGAVGALVGGLALLALQVFLTKGIRVHLAERIRQIGLIAAAKQALFEVPEPDLDFSRKRTS